MGYKTIYAILRDAEAAAGFLPSALAFAQRMKAHITGINMQILPVPVMAPAEFPDTSLLAGSMEANRQKSMELGRRFAALASSAGLSHDFQTSETVSGDLESEIMAGIRTADLLVAAPADSSSLEALVAESGRPVLFLAEDGRGTAFARPVIAWNASAQASRAVFDALPFLEEAGAAEIITLDAGEADRASAARLAATLGRHGVAATVSALKTDGRSVDDAIADHARQSGADLLVMGAFGHSRLREFFFGGVSRKVLDGDLPCSVIMSH